jgi:hypothetical protein
MAENRAAPPPKIHAIPIAIPAPELQSNTCPNEPEPYSASLGLIIVGQVVFLLVVMKSTAINKSSSDSTL